MIQDIIAISIAMLAVVYAGRVCWLSLRGKRDSSCGSCGSCSSNQQPLVQIQLVKK